jgi:hypothetical protein
MYSTVYSDDPPFSAGNVAGISSKNYSMGGSANLAV